MGAPARWAARSARTRFSDSWTPFLFIITPFLSARMYFIRTSLATVRTIPQRFKIAIMDATPVGRQADGELLSSKSGLGSAEGSSNEGRAIRREHVLQPRLRHDSAARENERGRIHRRPSALSAKASGIPRTVSGRDI